jgi:hypothetical protein
MAQTNEPGWWSRNAKWAVPVAVAAIVISIAAFAFGIVMFVFSLLKASDAYQLALSRVRADPIVIETLGTPINDGWFTSGHMRTSGPSGDAAMAIPISGPKGSATIYVEASKSAGEWTMTKLVVEFASSKRRIDLLAAPTTIAPPRFSPGWPDLATLGRSLAFATTT